MSIEEQDFKITIKTNQEPTYVAAQPQQQMVAQVPAAAPAPVAAAAAAPAPIAVDDASKYITVKSPMIGTFQLVR